MKNLTLVIGDKNLSSWSLRAWLVAKLSELPFEEVLIPLDQSQTKQNLQKWSPSEKVPCLIHENHRIWDSLSIAEYFAELAPNKYLWPQDLKTRATARSYVCEMHSGFDSLRSQLSMDIRLRIEIRHLMPSTIHDIDRILFLWTQALNKSKGPFLFNEFGIVDAFYAPIVLRFQSYGVKIESDKIKRYMEEVLSHPHVKEWISSALNETPAPVIFTAKNNG